MRMHLLNTSSLFALAVCLMTAFGISSALASNFAYTWETVGSDERESAEGGF